MNGYVDVLVTTVTALVTLIPGLAYLRGGAPAAAPQTIRRTLPVAAGQHLFELSNVTGSVRIIGEDRQDVSVVAVRTVAHQGDANDPGPTVDVREEAGRVLACGDTFRCGCHLDSRGDNWRDDTGRTRVRVDFDVHLPKALTLDICMVNGGTLTVEGTEGHYTLRTVNVNLEMLRFQGAGRASTVNGDIEASFVAAPDAPAEFKTVNGRVSVTLPASLSADLRLKTINGGLYTDFETTALPTLATSERRGGRFVYRSNRYASVRVGKGGPELTFETLNGDVLVKKH